MLSKRPGVHSSKNKPGGGRPYQARPCVVCGSEASYAIHVTTRTIGVGQGRERRQMKTSGAVLFCGDHARRVKDNLGELETIATSAMSHVMRPPRQTGPALFESEA